MTSTDAHTDIIADTSPAEQAAIRRRLDEIWVAAAARDFDLLESYHRYGPTFTAFKEGARRDDAASTAAGERALFSVMEGPAVDMRDLAVNVYGDVAIATFNGHFTGAIRGNPVAVDQQTTMVFVNDAGDWKIVHEHLSPLVVPRAVV